MASITACELPFQKGCRLTHGMTICVGRGGTGRGGISLALSSRSQLEAGDIPDGPSGQFYSVGVTNSETEHHRPGVFTSYLGIRSR